MSRLLLVRHGITQLQRGDRFWGKTDIDLSSTGIKQAEQLRGRLAAEKIRAIYSSTLSRARNTAEIIASGHHLEVIACDELCECNFGYAEGLNFEEIKRLYPALAEELSNGKTGSFPGGETIEQLNNRVQNFLKRLKNHKPNDTIAIVAHGGPLRLIICSLLGIEISHWQQIKVEHASLSIVETYPQATILALLNDVSHLKT